VDYDQHHHWFVHWPGIGGCSVDEEERLGYSPPPILVGDWQNLSLKIRPFWRRVFSS